MCSPHSQPANISPTIISDDGLHFQQQHDSQHLSSQPYGSNTFGNYSLSSANHGHFAQYQLHPENQGKNVLAAGADPDATFSQDLAMLAYHSGLNDDQLRRGSTCSSTSSSFSAYTAASGSTSVPSDEAYGYFSDVSPVSTFASEMEQPSQLFQKAFLTPNRGLGLLALHPGSPVQSQAPDQHHPHYQLQGQQYEHHTPSIARYACTFTDCSWATDRRDLVKDHVARCHAAIFTCSVEGCSKQFSQYASLEMHQIYHQFQRNQFMQTTVLDAGAHHQHHQPQIHSHFPPPQQSSTVGLGLVSDPFLDNMSPRQSFYPPAPPSLQAPFEYNAPTAALVRRASESDVGIYVPPPSHTYNNSMSTLYEDDIYPNQQPACSPPITAVQATFSSPTVADAHILSSSPLQLQQHVTMEYSPVREAVVDPVYISPPHQVVHIQPLPTVTTSQYQSPPSASPLPLVREDTLESYDGFSQESIATSNNSNINLSPTSSTSQTFFEPHRVNSIHYMHSSPRAPLGRAARINLSRRGSEASYFASHPRFASHPYFPVRASSASSNYLSVAPSRIEGHFLHSIPGRTIYQEEEHEEVDIEDDDDEEYSEGGKGSQDARAETALAAAAAATRRGTTPALKQLNTRRSVPVPPVVVNPNTKMHACDFEGCDRLFKRLEHKRRHERSHTQEKPYGCDVPGCGRFFSRSDNLTQHKRTHKKDGRTKRVTQANLSNKAKADSSEE